MDSHCRQYERFLDAKSPTSRDEWMQHIRGCSSCRLQWEAHQELESLFTATATPQLSKGFSRRVAKLAGLERAARIMRFYWLAAGLSVVILLQRLDWAAIPASAWVIGLGGLAGLTVVAALPILGSRRGHRMSLLDLVVETASSG